MSLFPIYSTPVVNRLLSLIVNGVEEDSIWLEKAVKSLAKKLRKSRQLEDFEKVLHSKDPLTKCITIARSLDGRLQIAHRKVLPHVAYCRLYRWPDLHSYHELKALGNCEYSFIKKRDLLCINPYHYYRAELLIMPPICIPKNGRNDKEIIKGQEIRVNNGTLTSNLYQNNIDLNRIPSNKILYNDGYFNTINNINNFNSPIMAPLSIICEIKNGNIIEPIVNLIPNKNYIIGNNDINSENYSMNLLQNFRNGACESLNEECYKHKEEICDENEVKQIQGEIDKLIYNSILPALDNYYKNSTLLIDKNIGKELINYETVKYWCTISVNEYNVKIGQSFISNSKMINIDFESSIIKSDCFGLKSYKNVFRSDQFLQLKKSLGNAICLTHGGGEVIIECKAKNITIFVSSCNYNVRQNKSYDSVHQLRRGDTMTIFDYHDFAPMLSTCINHSYEAVYKLLSWTIIRFSFFKGWGENFKRQNPDETPLWFEIKLNGPMNWLDRIIRQLVSPNSICSSLT